MLRRFLLFYTLGISDHIGTSLLELEGFLQAFDLFNRFHAVFLGRHDPKNMEQVNLEFVHLGDVVSFQLRQDVIQTEFGDFILHFSEEIFDLAELYLRVPQAFVRVQVGKDGKFVNNQPFRTNNVKFYTEECQLYVYPFHSVRVNSYEKPVKCWLIVSFNGTLEELFEFRGSVKVRSDLAISFLPKNLCQMRKRN